MKLNRTGRKFAMFYVAVMLTFLVCGALASVGVPLVSDVALWAYWELAFLALGRNYWMFFVDSLFRHFPGFGVLAIALDSEYGFFWRRSRSAYCCSTASAG